MTARRSCARTNCPATPRSATSTTGARTCSPCRSSAPATVARTRPSRTCGRSGPRCSRAASSRPSWTARMSPRVTTDTGRPLRYGLGFWLATHRLCSRSWRAATTGCRSAVLARPRPRPDRNGRREHDRRRVAGGARARQHVVRGAASWPAMFVTLRCRTRRRRRHALRGARRTLTTWEERTRAPPAAGRPRASSSGGWQDR